MCEERGSVGGYHPLIIVFSFYKFFYFNFTVKDVLHVTSTWYSHPI